VIHSMSNNIHKFEKDVLKCRWGVCDSKIVWSFARSISSGKLISDYPSPSTNDTLK